jgi:hypothetical protein
MADGGQRDRLLPSLPKDSVMNSFTGSIKPCGRREPFSVVQPADFEPTVAHKWDGGLARRREAGCTALMTCCKQQRPEDNSLLLVH